MCRQDSLNYTTAEPSELKKKLEDIPNPEETRSIDDVRGNFIEEDVSEKLCMTFRFFDICTHHIFAFTFSRFPMIKQLMRNVGNILYFQ